MAAFVTGLPIPFQGIIASKTIARALCSRKSAFLRWGTSEMHNGILLRSGYVTLTPTANASDRDKLLRDSEARGVSREITDRILSAADRVVRTWTATVSEFVTPPESEVLVSTLSELSDVRVEAWGGYEQAERKVLAMAHSDIAESNVAVHDLVKDELACLEIKGNFLFDVATHRDFLGAVVGAGITRQKVGDIILSGDRGCQVIVLNDVAEYLCTAISKVRSVPVKVERLDWSMLEVRPPSMKEMTIVEASMRLDAVASAGFSMSRSKFAELVRAGDCQVNYKIATSPAKGLKTSDVVSLRGKGKLEVGETSLTAKGRHRILITRYV